MHIKVILYALLIDFLAILSPGPDFFMVLRNSMANSMKAGIYTTLGISLGSALMFTLGIFGIAAIVISSKNVSVVIKFIGALYLVYLAFKSIVSKVHIVEPQLTGNKESKSLQQYFRMGLICNLTNPKALMFIVSLSTYVAENGNPYLDGSIIVFGSTLATFSWFSMVSLMFSQVRIRQFFYKEQRLINITFGCILLYIAYKIMFIA